MAISKLTRRYRTGLHLEALEPRTLLAVAANDDSYAAMEDTPPNTAAVTVIPQYAGLWYVNDDLSNSVNQYPTDEAGRNWAARDYDIRTPPIGAWFGPIPGPFVNGAVNAFDGVPRTIVDMSLPTEATFLLRRPFTLDSAMAEAVWGRITYTCDDGCIMYINGVRAASSPNMADILSPTPDTFVGTTGDEDPPHAIVTFGVNGAGQPPLYVGDNALAVEVHNSHSTSEDIGGDFSLAIAPQGGSILTNDNFASQIGPLVLTKLSDAVDETTGSPAGSVTLNTDTLSPDFGTFAYAPAANYCGTASWTYQIDDSSLTPSTGKVRLSVACDNDSPMARDDFYSVNIGAVLNVTTAAGLLANDTDVEADMLTMHTVDTSSVTAQGTLNVNADGSFTFDPYATAAPGAYRFTYRAADSGSPSAMSNVATVEITITPGCDENADLDNSGRVGHADLAIVAAHFGSRTATPDQGDFDCDGKVGLSDIILLKRQWAPPSASAPAAVVVENARLPHDARSLPADQTRRLSAMRSGVAPNSVAAATLDRQTVRAISSADAALSKQYLATRFRAHRRAVDGRRHAVDAAFSAWVPTL